MALVPFDIVKKIFKDLENKGFAPEWSDGFKGKIFISNEDGLLGYRGLRGWQLIEIHNACSQYDCDFRISRLVEEYKQIELELLTASETVDGYDFNYIEQYCK